MMPSTTLGWIVISLATLVIAVGGFVAVMVILVFVGGPTSTAVCGERALAVGSGAGLRFDGRWDGFDAFLDTGVPESLDLEEAEVTERARSFLTVENDVDEIRDVVVCFLGPEEAGGLGRGELRGKVAIPVLPDVSGRVRGRLDLSGPQPALEVTDIDLGSVPGFLTSRAGGAIEEAINAALADVALQHHYTIDFFEGFVRINGRP